MYFSPLPFGPIFLFYSNFLLFFKKRVHYFATKALKNRSSTRLTLFKQPCPSAYFTDYAYLQLPLSMLTYVIITPLILLGPFDQSIPLLLKWILRTASYYTETALVYTSISVPCPNCTCNFPLVAWCIRPLIVTNNLAEVYIFLRSVLKRTFLHAFFNDSVILLILLIMIWSFQLPTLAYLFSFSILILNQFWFICY